MCDLSNPKTLLVFTRATRQFLPTDGGHRTQAAVLGMTFATLGLLSLLTSALVFGRIGLAGLESRLGDAILRIGGPGCVARHRCVAEPRGQVQVPTCIANRVRPSRRSERLYLALSGPNAQTPRVTSSGLDAGWLVFAVRRAGCRNWRA